MSKTEKDGNWFKRHKVMTVILALIAIGVAGSAAGSGGKKKDDATTSSSTSSSNSTSNSKATTVAKVGEAVRDGKFEFTVKNVNAALQVLPTTQAI